MNNTKISLSVTFELPLDLTRSWISPTSAIPEEKKREKKGEEEVADVDEEGKKREEYGTRNEIWSHTLRPHKVHDEMTEFINKLTIEFLFSIPRSSSNFFCRRNIK